MIEDVALIGLCGSRNLPPCHRKLVTSVVRSLAQAGRGIAVGCAAGADEMGLRACFTESGELGVPRLDVFAAFGRDGKGSWRHSAVELVQWVSQHPKADSDDGREPPITVSWWAGGAPPTPLVPRLKGRTKAMVTAVDMSGGGCGLVAFVVGGPSKSPGTWNAIRLAIEKGVPVVTFPCGCSVSDFPSLGKGRWVTAGSGVWERGWRWVPAGRAIPRSAGRHLKHAQWPAPRAEEEYTSGLEAFLSELLGWKKAPPIRRTTQLDFPLFLNLRRYLYEQNCPNLITDKEV